MTCLDITMYKSAPEYKWSLGHCLSRHKYIGPGTYTEKCCTSEKKITLTCSTNTEQEDWSMHTVMLRGHQFCDDLVGRKGMIEIDLAGIRTHLNIDMIEISLKILDIHFYLFFILIF